MSNTNLDNDNTLAPAPVSTVEPSTDEAARKNLGPFLPWRAASVFDATLADGLTRYVAIQLARKTPKSGVIRQKARELADYAGVSKATVERSMVDIEAAGLITHTRTRDGNIWRWTALAYGVGAASLNLKFNVYRTLMGLPP